MAIPQRQCLQTWKTLPPTKLDESHLKFNECTDIMGTMARLFNLAMINFNLDSIVFRSLLAILSTSLSIPCLSLGSTLPVTNKAYSYQKAWNVPLSREWWCHVVAEWQPSSHERVRWVQCEQHPMPAAPHALPCFACLGLHKGMRSSSKQDGDVGSQRLLDATFLFGIIENKLRQIAVIITNSVKPIIRPAFQRSETTYIW